MTFGFFVSMCACLDLLEKIQTPKTHLKTSLEHKVTVHIVSSILPNLSIQKLQLYQAFQDVTIKLLRTVSKSQRRYKAFPFSPVKTSNIAIVPFEYFVKIFLLFAKTLHCFIVGKPLILSWIPPYTLSPVMHRRLGMRGRLTVSVLI